MPTNPHATLAQQANSSSSSSSSSSSTREAELLSAENLAELCARVHARVEAFLNARPENKRVAAVQVQSRLSLEIIAEALRKYRLDEISLSYNGGKDCLVLLILYLSALHTYSQTQPNAQTSTTNHTQSSTTLRLPTALPSVYIISPHPFPEVDAFVTHSEKIYHLALSRYAQPMKVAFSSYLAEHTHVRAIFVGTRRTDPHGADLEPFLPTDRGWPAFMRIHPVLDWHYADIWTFIRALGIPYCELYDRGYTSLGGTTDTEPNPALREEGKGVPEEEGRFRPAYELLMDEEERLGRS